MQYGLATYQADDATRPAFVFEGRLVDLSDVVALTDGDGDRDLNWMSSGGLNAIFRKWDEVGKELDILASRAMEELDGGNLSTVSDDVRVMAPIEPERIFCAASNYIEHADEMGTVLAAKSESNPYIFMKPPSCVIGNGDTVVKPAGCEMLDWEVELAVVIGRRCRHVSVSDSLEVVAGYTIINDVSARDLNVRDDYPFKFDWFQGKCHDTFGPLGPWIVPSSSFGDPHNVRLQLDVNGETMQDGNTNKLIFNIAEQISYLSNILTLEPGDVIASGTPDGVGMGRGIFLKPGDIMVASIDGIGTLTNPVVGHGGS